MNEMNTLCLLWSQRTDDKKVFRSVSFIFKQGSILSDGPYFFGGKGGLFLRVSFGSLSKVMLLSGVSYRRIVTSFGGRGWGGGRYSRKSMVLSQWTFRYISNTRMVSLLFSHNNLLLAECEVRTASYGPSFFLPFMAQARSARAMKIRKEKTRIHNLPYGLSKRG